MSFSLWLGPGACRPELLVGEDGLRPGPETGAGGGLGGNGTAAGLGSAGVGATTGGTSATGGDGGTSGGGGKGPTGCIPGGPACFNCLDDDGDGLVDAEDPDCLGPQDTDESSLGSGRDLGTCLACPYSVTATACRRSITCEAAQPPDPACGPDCTAPTSCTADCLPWVPNGCDCYGCCQVGHTGKRVRLVPTCTAAGINDPTLCPTCEMAPDCLNDCARCELCVGETSVQPDCQRPGELGLPVCPIGTQSCRPSLPCPLGLYCVTGCCVSP